MNRVKSSFSLWSLLSLALAVPVWIMVFRGSVLGREVDGGIFLSISDGLANGLNRYTDLWDNKDPFFGAFMAGASHISPTLPFFMDLLWIPLAALGAYFIARSVTSGDRALFLGLVATPFLIVGPFYVAGWANTPGTALVLLGWGLLAVRRWVLGGLVIGLLFFIKITVWPIALLGLLLFLVLGSEKRRGAVRALVAMGIMMAISFAVMLVLGWLPGYIDMIGQNQAYSKAVITYFGFEDSPFGHIEKLRTDWTGAIWFAVGLAVLVAVIGLVVSLLDRRRRAGELVASAYLIVALVGSSGALAFTYLWPHHVQALSLPLILAAILAGALIPSRVWFAPWVVLMIVVTFVLSAWGSVSTFTTHYSTLADQFTNRQAAISFEPLDANLLNTVPLSEFTFARLGTNDDQGFLGSVREGATLGCPRFHDYDFSPAEAFTEQLKCIQGVDVILKTTNFDVFANGMNAANVQPILDFVNANFNCLIVNDRQLCTRK